MTDHLKAILNEAGGEFLISAEEITRKLHNISAFVFDWDGVFNPGIKSTLIGSPFSEADSMGTNMLRFSYWLKYGTLPFTSIITGENNSEAIHLAEREHFHAVFFGFANKTQAMSSISAQFGILPQSTAFVFDDILDLSLARAAGLRFLIRRKASPMMTRYVKEKKLADYISGNEGGNHAVREVCELLIALKGNFTETLDRRVEFGESYKQYLLERNAVKLQTFSAS